MAAKAECGPSRAAPGWGAGTAAGQFVCLLRKREPGETVARFSLDGMGANGSVWQGGSLELISLGSRRGAQGRRGRGLGPGVGSTVWLSRTRAVNNPLQVAANGSAKTRADP